MEQILNLTQHSATKEQLEAGVYEPEDKMKVINLLSFNSLPSKDTLIFKAHILASYARKCGAKKVMLGGAPFFMPFLERALKGMDIEVVYAFSVRDSKEEIQPDGSVRKVNFFRHAGFVAV